MVTAKAVKTTALTTLRGNWARACTAAMIPVCASIVSIIIGYINALPLGVIVSDVVTFLVFLLICAPLGMGAVRYFWRMANGCQDSAAEVFYYFSYKKEYLRVLSFNIRVIIHWVIVGFLLFLPAIIAYIFTYGLFFEWIGVQTPLLFVNLRYLVGVFEFAATVAAAWHLMLLHLPAFLFVSNTTLKPKECMKRGISIGKYTKVRFSNHLFYFMGWIALSLLFIPLLFTLPYLLMSYIIECRYNVALYNIAGKAANDDPMHEV